MYYLEKNKIYKPKKKNCNLHLKSNGLMCRLTTNKINLFWTNPKKKHSMFTMKLYTKPKGSHMFLLKWIPWFKRSVSLLYSGQNLTLLRTILHVNRKLEYCYIHSDPYLRPSRELCQAIFYGHFACSCHTLSCQCDSPAHLPCFLFLLLHSEGELGEQVSVCNNVLMGSTQYKSSLKGNTTSFTYRCFFFHNSVF